MFNVKCNSLTIFGCISISIIVSMLNLKCISLLVLGWFIHLIYFCYYFISIIVSMFKLKCFTDHIRMYLGSRCAMQCRISITYKSSYSSCSSGPNFSSTCKLSPRYIYIYIYISFLLAIVLKPTFKYGFKNSEQPL